MEKMKKWFSPSFDDEDISSSPPKKPKMFSKEKSVTAISLPPKKGAPSVDISKSIMNVEDWMKNFEPTALEDLAVHNKKVQEVESWFSGALRTRGEMLLISGPVGSGKTATVQVLAAKHNVRIKEWITPHDTELPAVDGKFECREKQSNIFRKFLVDAGCYFSLLDGSNTDTMLLVEDYPNTFLKNPSEFADVLRHYKERRAKSPIVFICSECYSESRDTAFNLFSNALKDQYKINHISFNSVSATGLKMALKRVSQIISKRFSSVYNTPSAELIECVVNSSAGDVRSAVLNLHFASLKGMTMRPSEQSVTVTDAKGKKTKKKKATSKFQAIGKDESVTLLRGVGRALNPKLLEERPHRQFTHPPLEIIEQFSSQPASFLGFLYENYLPHFSSAEHVARAATALSDADYMLSEWREKFCQLYGLYVGVAGLMVANKAPVSAWNPVRGPKNMRITYLSSRDIPLLEENQLHNGKVLASDYKTYCNIISSGQQISTFDQSD